jgi:hypothetical protein
MMARAGEEINVNLAVSLHAVNKEVRDELVPLNRKYGIDELLRACAEYPGISNARRITFEYVMLKDKNDSDADARELVSLIRQYKLPAKVNLIPFNPWPGATYECSDPERIKRFSSIIFEAGISAPIRTPRGGVRLRHALCSDNARWLSENRDRLHARQHRFASAVPCGHILTARAIGCVVRLARQIPPAIFGGWRICQHIDLPVHGAHHSLFGHQAHRRGRECIANTDQLGNMVQPIMLGQPVPACETICCQPQLEPFVWILHMASEKRRRTAANRFGRWNWRQFRSWDIRITEVALAAVHEDEIACQANAVRTCNLHLDERSVLSAPQDLCADLNIARQGPNKGNLCRL